MSEIMRLRLQLSRLEERRALKKEADSLALLAPEHQQFKKDLAAELRANGVPAYMKQKEIIFKNPTIKEHFIVSVEVGLDQVTLYSYDKNHLRNGAYMRHGSWKTLFCVSAATKIIMLALEQLQTESELRTLCTGIEGPEQEQEFY